jgi:hypothetical protein
MLHCQNHVVIEPSSHFIRLTEHRLAPSAKDKYSRELTFQFDCGPRHRPG